MFAKIQKFSKQDKLALMRKESKFKKMVFSELPSDFALFKQFGITASKMFQNFMTLMQPIKNSSQLKTSMRLMIFWHLSLHYIAPRPTDRDNHLQLKLPKRLLHTWNGLLRKRNLSLLWKQMDGVFAVLSLLIQQATLSLHLSWSQSRLNG